MEKKKSTIILSFFTSLFELRRRMRRVILHFMTNFLFSTVHEKVPAVQGLSRVGITTARSPVRVGRHPHLTPPQSVTHLSNCCPRCRDLIAGRTVINTAVDWQICLPGRLSPEIVVRPAENECLQSLSCPGKVLSAIVRVVKVRVLVEKVRPGLKDLGCTPADLDLPAINIRLYPSCSSCRSWPWAGEPWPPAAGPVAAGVGCRILEEHAPCS